VEPQDLLDTALAAARDAAAVHAHYLGRVSVTEWTEKGTADFVTHVDREAERRILDRVRAEFPDHLCVAEEETTAPGAAAMGSMQQAEWAWVVDPLDGTTNFLHSYPMYAVSIAVAHRGRPILGVVLNSASGELWTAMQGRGAFRNGQPIRVSSVVGLRQSLLGTGFPFKTLDRLPEYTAQWEAALRSSSGVRRAGSAALDLCHVASGWFDGFWELTLAPWDVAAGAVIVREAGGVVTRIGGDEDVLGHGSVVAGNPAIHAALTDLLEQVTGKSGRDADLNP
jgi:myo-inositol-1(or 4)-monophosphatase